MLFAMFSASVLSYTLKQFRRIPQIFPKILRRNRQKSLQIPSGPTDNRYAEQICIYCYRVNK